MNVWNFTGNLGNDCESRYTPNGDLVVSFSVAVKSGFGERESTTWARCAMFGRRAESVAPYLLKGQLVGVSGELTAREWDDKNGLKRTSIEVRVSDLSLLGRRDASGAQSQNNAPQQQQQSAQTSQRQPQNQYAQQSGGSLSDLDDDLPF